MREKSITVLGSTGSVGARTLSLVSQFPECFRVKGLAARGTRLDVMAEQIRRFRPKAVGLLDETKVDELARVLPHPRPEILGGIGGVAAVAAQTEGRMVVSALVGAAGLIPTMAAIKAGRDIALANKEVLVMAGSLVTAETRARGVSLLPVDSEHSAIFQCLVGHRNEDVKRIYLTASGGPFFDRPRETMADVTAGEALNHPTWRMGAKITIDSATLMNKGFEIIEARWLFGLELEQISVIVHRQSIVHSMVEFLDGSVIAQMAVPDMGIPILYALTYPERLPCPAPSLDFAAIGSLTFAPPDEEKFPCLLLARQAAKAGGGAPVVLNAANEVAVEGFLDGRIGFMEIPALIADALETIPVRPLAGIEDCIEIDQDARRYVRQAIARRSGSAGPLH